MVVELLRKKSREKEIYTPRPFNDLTIWCFLKQFPCKNTCQMYDLKAEKCKIEIVLDLLIQEGRQLGQIP